MKSTPWISILRPALVTAALVVIDVATSYGAEAPITGEGGDSLEQLLASSERLSGAHYSVDIENNIAHLSGQVATLDQAELIASSALRVDGIYGVVQGVKVAPSSRMSDQAITRMLSKSPVLENADIQVAVSDDGTATVSGTVGCYDEIDVARELVSRVEGIQRIEIDATIDPFRLRPDGAIEAQLLVQFSDDPIISAREVIPSFENGIVHLSGSVATVAERDRLLLSSLVTGVMESDISELTIDPNLEIPGVKEKNLQTADILRIFDLVIDADSRLDGSHFVAGFVGDRLVIDGTASSPAARDACLADARALPGIRGIDARIELAGPALSSNN